MFDGIVHFDARLGVLDFAFVKSTVKGFFLDQPASHYVETALPCNLPCNFYMETIAVRSNSCYYCVLCYLTQHVHGSPHSRKYPNQDPDGSFFIHVSGNKL